MKTADVLSELEEMGALGEPAPSLRRVEEVGVETGAPSTKILDERGARMVEACERVVSHLDKAIGEMQGLRESILEMKAIWEPTIVEDEYEGVEGEPEVDDDDLPDPA